jgi:hypothetical protein
MILEETAALQRFWLVRLLERYILRRVWYAHHPDELTFYATPVECLQRMMVAAKPSVQRLHLRSLFVRGRRYHITPRENGFQMTTTSKVLWRYRRRTSSAVVLKGDFSPLGGGVTRISMNAHISIIYLLRQLFFPAFIASIVIPMPWHPNVIVVMVFALFALMWSGQRCHSILEAKEMLWFVRKSLEDFAPEKLLPVGEPVDDIVSDAEEFEEVWQRFYNDKK